MAAVAAMARSGPISRISASSSHRASRPGRLLPRGLGTPSPRPLSRAGWALRAADSNAQGLDLSTGGVPPGSGSGGGGGDGESGDAGGNGESGDAGGNGSTPAAVLLASKAAESLPAEFAEALKSGKLPVEIAQRFLDLDRNPFLGWLMRTGGFRERLLADPSFMVKVAIEVGIGVCTKCTAEYTKRGKDFGSQIDFVFANVLMAIVADFMLVWLPAPTFSLNAAASTKKAGALAGLFAGCPDNAFQKVQPGMAPFSLGQRFGAVVRNGLKLFGVGLFASLLGVGVTNSLVAARQFLDPSFVPLNPPQNVLALSAAYGVYMSSSSNLRYQILAGLIEERGIETVFRSNPTLCAVLSFIVRTGNTFLGSLLWVDFLTLTGLQKLGTSDH